MRSAAESENNAFRFVAALLSFLALPGCHGAPPARGLVTIRFPTAWTRSDRSVVTAPFQFRVRRMHATRFAIGVETPGGGWARDFYAVDLASRTPVPARITESEWKTATPIKEIVERLLTPSGAGSTGERITVDGRQFAKTGERWATVLRSGAARYIAAVSYTPLNQPKQTGVLASIGGGEPSEGVLHLEIFDGRTGARLVAGQRRYSGLSATILADAAFWLESEWFIIPVDALGQTVWIAAVD